MSRNSVIGETELLDGAVARLRDLLPAYWKVSLTRDVRVSDEPEADRIAPQSVADGILSLSTPRGAPVELALEIKSSVRNSESLMWELDRLRASTGLDVVLVTEYANPTVRAKCADRGFGYLDGTGWVRLESRRPPLFVLQPGAARAPRSDRDSDISRLSGVGASRIIRTLLASQTPVGVRELAATAGVSPGSVAKLLPTLATAGSIERDERGAVVLIRRRQLVERWAQDYSFLRNNAITWWLAPRGLENALVRVRDLLGVAATGSLVARDWLPPQTASVTPLTLAALYVGDVGSVVAALRLKSVPPTKANLVLALPRDERLLAGAAAAGDLPQVPLAQALVDLLTLPGRSIEEAEQVMDVMASTDPSWLQEGVLL